MTTHTPWERAIFCHNRAYECGVEAQRRAARGAPESSVTRSIEFARKWLSMRDDWVEMATDHLMDEIDDHLNA